MARAFTAAQPSGINLGAYTNVHGPWSFVAWCRPLSFTDRKIFQQGDDAGGPPFAEFGFMFRQTTNPFAELFVETSDGTFSSANGDVSAWTPGTRHLVCGTWNQSQLKLYLDGSLVDTASTNATMATSGNPVATLGYSSEFGFNFDGDIYEVAIFSHASTADILTSTEVSTLWNGGAGGYVSALLSGRTDLAYNWRMDHDDGLPNPVQERIANNDGTVTGTTQLVPHPFSAAMIALVGTPSYNTAESVSSLAVTRTVTAGSGLIVRTMNYNSDITGISSSPSNTFVETTGARVTDGSGAHFQAFRVNSAASGSTTITITVAGGSYPSMVVDEISGHDTSSMIEASNAGSGSSAAQSSGSVTTTRRCLLLGLCGSSVGYDGGYAPDTGWTELLDVKPATFAAYQSQYQVADAGTYTSSETSTGSVQWGANVVAIAEASAGTTDGVGASAGSATAAGVGASTAASAAASTGTSSATAVGASIFAAVGSAAGAGSGSATGATTAAGVAASAGGGAATAIGASTAAGVASAAGASSASGDTSGNAAGAAAASGVGAATAVGASTNAASAATTGVATATGVGASIVAAVGASAGSSIALAVGASTVAGAASSAGASFPAGTGAATVASIATATGAASVTAAGVTISGNVGSAAGASSVTAVGASIVAAVASSTGVSGVGGVGASTAAGVASSIGTVSATGNGAATVAAVFTAEGRSDCSAVSLLRQTPPERTIVYPRDDRTIYYTSDGRTII